MVSQRYTEMFEESIYDPDKLFTGTLSKMSSKESSLLRQAIFDYDILLIKPYLKFMGEKID